MGEADSAVGGFVQAANVTRRAKAANNRRLLYDNFTISRHIPWESPFVRHARVGPCKGNGTFMDSLRGLDGHVTHQAEGDSARAAYDSHDHGSDHGLERPPEIGVNERRMQVRAYNFWTQLLRDAPYPSIEDLEPENAGDFGAHGVLLDFTSGIDNPAVQYIGEAIAEECGLDKGIQWLEQVPPRSLLSRITDHYMQILANRAPIGFEAEFINQRGVTILYRGILLPFSSDGDTIDFIFGVINWKEAVPAPEQAALEAEVAVALHTSPVVQEQVPAWADTPQDDELDLAPFAAAVDAAPVAMPVIPRGGFVALGDAVPMVQGELVDEPAPDADAALADWLASARMLAEAAVQAESRGRKALYEAIGRAYDCVLKAEANPDEYRAALADAGLEVQDRAPYTPLAKLIFGVGYDKTRLAEIACALGFAHGQRMQAGSLSSYLAGYGGGLKALVADCRAARKADGLLPRTDPALALREKMRARPVMDLADFTGGGAEFVVLVGRRNDHGEVELIGAVDNDDMTVKLLKKLK